jgi:hypothetical protein
MVNIATTERDKPLSPTTKGIHRNAGITFAHRDHVNDHIGGRRE